MIQIDVVGALEKKHCMSGGGRVTGETPLTLVRRLKTPLTFRFCNESGGTDTGVTAAMLALPQCALTLGDRVLAVTDSGFAVSVDSGGVLAVTFAQLVTDTAPVRAILADELTRSVVDGVDCFLEFSSRSSTTESGLSIWFAMPVRLLNPEKKMETPADTPEEQNLYLTAAETRAAIREGVETGMPYSSLSNGSFIPRHGQIYTRTLISGDTFLFQGSQNAAARLTFELHLVQPSTPVSFTWGNTIWWADANGHFADGNNPPDFSTGGRIYALAFRFDGTRWLGNLCYTSAVN